MNTPIGQCSMIVPFTATAHAPIPAHTRLYAPSTLDNSRADNPLATRLSSIGQVREMVIV